MVIRLRQWLKKNAYWGVSLLIFVGIIGIFVYAKSAREKTYQIVCLGDSIVGNVRDATSIPAYIATETGMAVYNGGFGGTMASSIGDDERAAVGNNVVSLPKLVDALCYDNFSVQNAGINRFATIDYFVETVEGFNTLDWSEVEIIVIEHGVNDYFAGAVMDNPENPYDVTTYGGALRYSLRQLQTMRPDIRIILCTPTYCWLCTIEKTCEEVEFGGGYLKDYVDLELKIAEEFGVEVVDNFYESGIGGEYEYWSVYTMDGVHLNENGRRLVAQRISEAIMGEAK